MKKLSTMATITELLAKLALFRNGKIDAAETTLFVYRYIIPALNRTNTVAERMQELRNQQFKFVWTVNPVVIKPATQVNGQIVSSTEPPQVTYGLWLRWTDGSNMEVLVGDPCTAAFKAANESTLSDLIVTRSY